MITLRHSNITVEEALGRYLLQLLDGAATVMSCSMSSSLLWNRG